MERKYTVYKITAPDGCCYIGWTSMTIQERWRNHVWRANNGGAKEHPFYNAILKYGKDAFTVEELYVVSSREQAQELEVKCIAEVPSDYSYNLSAGGVNDASEGGRIFWERLNADPEKRAAFLKKLSEIKKANDWTDYESLVQSGKQWRHENPREAYKQAYRAIRIANKKRGAPPPCQDKVNTRPLKERLMHKHKLNELKRLYVTEIWKNRSEEARREIADKISASRKSIVAEMSMDEKRQMTEKARSSIDREKQGAAASKGLKAWWENLKKDPERYEAYIQRRIASRKEKKYANV